MNSDGEKKSGAVWILVSIVVLASVALLVFGRDADRRLREFFKNSGAGEKVNGYVVYPDKKNQKESKKEDEQEEISLISVPFVEMSEGFPTGCESSGAVMLLRYCGIDITLDDFVDNYLTCSALKLKNGRLTGPTPNEAFIGNPRESGGYGCYAPVIAESISKLLSEQKENGKKPEIKNLTGAPIKTLEEYVLRGTPVLIWATNNMSEPSDGTSWRIKGTKEEFTWKRGEHCLVMTGADEENYYFNDPVRGEGISYEKSLVENRYKQLGSQAIIILSEKDG